ncbi:MAG TPA: hypothetical protein VKA05_08085 [Acidimicrobiales bacterium]|nr:hypothetical protein [Acidimicrobiales bacterium]
MSDLNELFDLLKRYVLQETVGPFKTIGRTLGYGTAAALLFGISGVFALLGVLRVLESETGSTFGGSLSWLPYLLTIVAGLILLAVAGAAFLRPPSSERGGVPGTPGPEAR